MLLVYTNRLTPRIKYTFRFVFGKLLGLDYRVTDDLDEFNVSSYARISYTIQPIEGIPFIQAKNLLFERGISLQDLHKETWNGIPIFFSTGKQSLLPFDLFSATFYMISRYEEYMPYIPDEFGRFPANESFACRNGFLHFPVVNMWVNKLKELLHTMFPALRFGENKYTFQPTFDIDIAYAYLHKGLTRTVGAFAKDVMNLNYQQITKRMKVLLRQDSDPFDTYQIIEKLHHSSPTKPIFFFLLADYGPLDKNIRWNTSALKRLVSSIADDYQVGIHPSFQSNSNTEILKEEIRRLEVLTHRTVRKSRQHFLKVSFPETYRNLLELEISDDYSLGFADLPGFRAGTSSPFNFFDLDMDQETPLILHPLVVMDSTLNTYMKLNPLNGLRTALDLLDMVKKFGGEFIPVWHNETLSDEFEWKGWRRVYQELIQKS